MTIGPSAAGLDAIQARTTRLLTRSQSTVTITRAGVPTTNPSTLAVTRSSSTIYSGAAFITAEAGEQGAGRETPGDKVRTVTDYRCRVPISATGVRVGDTVTVTAAEDGDLDGQAFRVTSIARQSWHSGRRLRMELIEAGART